MTRQPDLGGSLTLANTSPTVNRMGYGAMQLIPGTSSVAHLRENLAAGTLQLPRETIAALDQIAAGGAPAKQ